MPTSQPLSAHDIKKSLQNLPGWQIHDDKLTKEFTFKSYLAGINFVNIVASLAESLNHHPDMLISYRRVIVSCTTHDAGNRLSSKDFNLAFAITKFASFGSNQPFDSTEKS